MPPLKHEAFTFDVTETDDTVTFQLRGRLRLEDTAHLRKAFWECLHKGGARNLILELSQVPRLEASAVSLFVATRNVVAKRKGKLVLRGVQHGNGKLLLEAGLDKYFDLE